MPIDWDKLTGEQPVLEVIPRGLRDTTRMRAFKKGELLYRRGQPPEVILCVLSGEIRLVRSTPSGAEIVLQRSRGGFIAEASLDAQTYHCDVVSATDGRLMLFPVRFFNPPSRMILLSTKPGSGYWPARYVGCVHRANGSA